MYKYITYIVINKQKMITESVDTSNEYIIPLDDIIEIVDNEQTQIETYDPHLYGFLYGICIFSVFVILIFGLIIYAGIYIIKPKSD